MPSTTAPPVASSTTSKHCCAFMKASRPRRSPSFAATARRKPLTNAIYGGVVEVASLLLSGRLAEGLMLTEDVHAAVRGAPRVDPVGDLHMVTVGRLFARAEMGDLAGVAGEGTPAWAEWSLAGHRSPWCHWLAWVLGRAALVEGRARDAAQWFRRSEGTVLGTLPALLLGWVQDSPAYAELLAGDPAAAEALTAEGDREISMPADDGFGRPRPGAGRHRPW